MEFFEKIKFHLNLDHSKLKRTLAIHLCKQTIHEKLG